MLRASETFGSPAYLAKALNCAPHDVYRWIAGTDCPSPGEREQLVTLVRGALEQRSSAPRGARRWNDRQPLAA
jgi:hypothetical protein